MKFNVYNRDGDIVFVGKTNEVREFVGMAKGTSISQYLEGYRWYKDTYMIVRETDTWHIEHKGWEFILKQSKRRNSYYNKYKDVVRDGEEKK